MWPGRDHCGCCDCDWDRDLDLGETWSPSLGNLFAQRLVSEFICIILLRLASHVPMTVAKSLATIRKAGARLLFAWTCANTFVAFSR